MGRKGYKKVIQDIINNLESLDRFVQELTTDYNEPLSRLDSNYNRLKETELDPSETLRSPRFYLDGSASLESKRNACRRIIEEYYQWLSLLPSYRDIVQNTDLKRYNN